VTFGTELPLGKVMTEISHRVHDLAMKRAAPKDGRSW
jgi:hypothetical protein